MYIGSRKIPILSGGVGEQSLFPQIVALGPTGLFDISQLDTLFSDRSATPSTSAVVDGVVGTVLDLSGNSNHAISPSDAQRALLRLSSYHYLDPDRVDDGYDFGPITTARYVAVGMSVPSSPNTYENLMCHPTTDNSNIRIQLSSAEWREHTSGEFTSPGSTSYVNGVDTEFFTFDAEYVHEFTSSSSISVGRLFLGSSAGRYGGGHLNKMFISTSIPSSSERATIRSWCAEDIGVSL